MRWIGVLGAGAFLIACSTRNSTSDDTASHGTVSDDGSVDTSLEVGGFDDSSDEGADDSGTDGESGPLCVGAEGYCLPGQICDYQTDACGSFEADNWTCRPAKPPSNCEYDDIVCGCNGELYESECAAYAAKQDLSRLNNCEAPSGTFSCGPYFCEEGMEFCRFSVFEGVAYDLQFECTLLEMCSTCDCILATLPSDCNCEQNAEDIQVVCLPW